MHPAPLEIPVDAESITSDIDQALSTVDTSGLQGELDSTAGSASKVAQSGREAADGIGTIAPAAALATGELGATRDVLGEVTPAAAGSVAAIGGLVLAGKDLFSQALQQNTALTRLRDTYGELADRVEHVDFGGLNEDLASLAVRTGANVDGLRNFSASFGVLGKSAGDSLPHIADVQQQIQLLAVRASVLNPNLGTADEIVQRLSTSLARGGRFLSAYGIALSTAQINAEALRETGKTTASDLSIYDKIVAGATLATQGLGDALGTDINQGAQKAEVQLRSVKAAFEETLKAAGKPLIQPTIDAFKELEPVLAALAAILGTTLAGALHVIGPLLSGVATILKPIADVARSIPQPVIEAATAFLLFLKVGPILAGALDSLVSFVTLGNIQWAGFGAEAEVAAAEVQAAAAEIDAATGEAAAGVGALGGEAAAGVTAETGALAAGFSAIAAPLAVAAAGAALVGFAYARLTDDSAQLNAGTAELKKGFEDANSNLEDVATKFAQTQVSANDASGALRKTGLDATDLGRLAEQGKAGFQSLLDELVASGQISHAAEDALIGTGESATELARQANTGQSAIGRLDDQTIHLIDTFQRMQGVTSDTAHEALTAAVAHGQLSRAEEVSAISAHTNTDGHVDWLAVLQQLHPQLAGATAAIQQYGDKVNATDPTIQAAAVAQQKMNSAVGSAGQALELGLIASGQYTQAQIDMINAQNTNKDGVVDYGKALDALRPGLGAVAQDDANLAVGLDTTAQKFQAAQDAAKLFQDSVDELLAPMLDASNAEVSFHQNIDKLTESLVKNGNTIDLNTKQGQDNVSGLNALVTSGTTWIDKLIAEGATTDTVNAKRAEVIAKLKEMEQHYPALTPLIDGYIAKINEIPTDHPTTVELLNADGSINTANTLKAAVEGIPQAWSLLFNVDDHQARDELAGLNSDIAAVHAQWLALANAPGGATGLSRIHAAMAGGTFEPMVPVLVGERGPEIVTFPSEFTVHPHGQVPDTGGKLFENLIVNEVAQSPQATAIAVSRELGRVAKR